MGLVETVKSAPFVNEVYTASPTPYGPLTVSTQGLEVLASDEEQTETILSSLLKRSEELKIWNSILNNRQSTRRQIASVPPWVTTKEYGLRPHLQLKHCLLGSGSEGTAFQFYYPSRPIVIKLYDSPITHGREGIEQFNALIDATTKKTVYKTPTPYFATGYLCAMEDFSTHQDYFSFIREHPTEEIRLLEYLLKLAENDPLVADIGDIAYCYTGWEKTPPRTRRVTHYEKLSKQSSSVFITNYDPEATANEDRYKLATVDIRIDDTVKKNSDAVKTTSTGKASPGFIQFSSNGL